MPRGLSPSIILGELIQYTLEMQQWEQCYKARRKATRMSKRMNMNTRVKSVPIKLDTNIYTLNTFFLCSRVCSFRWRDQHFFGIFVKWPDWNFISSRTFLSGWLEIVIPWPANGTLIRRYTFCAHTYWTMHHSVSLVLIWTKYKQEWTKWVRG